MAAMWLTAHYSDTNRDIYKVRQLCGIAYNAHFSQVPPAYRHTSTSNTVRDIALLDGDACTCERRDIIRSPADFTVMYLGVRPRFSPFLSDADDEGERLDVPTRPITESTGMENFVYWTLLTSSGLITSQCLLN